MQVHFFAFSKEKWSFMFYIKIKVRKISFIKIVKLKLRLSHKNNMKFRKTNLFKTACLKEFKRKHKNMHKRSKSLLTRCLNFLIL